MNTPSAPEPPNKFTISGRTYETVAFLKKGESFVRGKVMAKRAMVLNANLGQKDGQLILKHGDEIPRKLRGKFYLVFTDWRHPSDPQRVAALNWNGNRWYQDWSWLDSGWGEYVRLVRRKT